MIGYYPQRETGELLYSSTARAISMLNPNWSAGQSAEHLLGSRNLTFGGILPNNCYFLQKNVPLVTGLTDQTIIDGSIFHLISPLLSKSESATLKQSVFKTKLQGMRNWGSMRTKEGVFLRYCVICASNDIKAGKPAIWRTIPNHPAVMCCDLHGCKLITTTARLCLDEIHDPAKWIDYETTVPPKASKEAIEIASDIRWLYEQKSNLTPGYKRITIALRKAFHDTKRYYKGVDRLATQTIIGDLIDKMGPTARILDPYLFTPGALKLPALSEKAPLPRYLLLSKLLGLSLQNLFERALLEPDKSWTATVVRLGISLSIRKAKQQLTEIITKHPEAGRKQIRELSPYLVGLVFRRDRVFYEKTMPSRRWRGRTSSLDWTRRDCIFCARIKAISTSLGDNAQSGRRILDKAHLPRSAFERAKGRLPLTKALVGALKESWHQSKQEKSKSLKYKIDTIYKKAAALLETPSGNDDKSNAAKTRQAPCSCLSSFPLVRRSSYQRGKWVN